MTDSTLLTRYTRTDTQAPSSEIHGLPPLPYNRLGIFWRPMIDMTDSAFAPMILRFIAPVSDLLSDPDSDRWSLFAMIGVSGTRHHVIRHADLPQYACEDPTGLASKLRTPPWSNLVDAIHGFGTLDLRRKQLVVFQLAQLSFIRFALKLAEPTKSSGDPDHDRYNLEVGRVLARYPGGHKLAIPIFAELAHLSYDPAVALHACFQGIGHSLRNADDLSLPLELEARGRELSRTSVPDDWYGHLQRSRFHRAVALLRMRQQRAADMSKELSAALDLADRVMDDARDDLDWLAAAENKRIVVEAQIKAASRSPSYRENVDLVRLCETLAALDPYSVQARLVIGEGFAELKDYEQAASWFAKAGELGSADGALGWYRAARCYEKLGDEWRALNAMGRCLELDRAAAEARKYVDDRGSAPVVPAADSTRLRLAHAASPPSDTPKVH